MLTTTSYTKDVPIAGIIYLHDITLRRYYGSTRLNLAMFRQLCGEEFFHSVIMATSQWDNLPNEEAGRLREQELRKGFWKESVEAGAKVMRIQHKPADQEAIINHLLDNYVERLNQKLDGFDVLQIQEEIVDLGKSIPATHAGQELKYTLEELLKLLKTSMDNTPDEKTRKEISAKQAMLKKQIDILKPSMGSRLKRVIGL